MGFAKLVKWVQREFGVPQEQRPTRSTRSSGTIAAVSSDAVFVDSPRPPVPQAIRTGRVVRISPSDPLAIEGPVGTIMPLPDSRDVDTWGVDVLAYYLPYHFCRRDWGIYIRSHGIVYLASKMKGGPLQQADVPLLEFARHLLFEHECFHFFTETAAARTEFSYRKPLYRPYFGQHPAWLHEEALAESHAFRRCIRGRWLVHREDVFNLMKKSPPGYRDFDQYLRTGRFERGQRDSAAYIMAPITATTDIPSQWPTDFLFKNVGRSLVPTYLVMDLGLGWLRVVRRYPKYKEMKVCVHTCEHPPAHFHIEYPAGHQKTKYLWPELVPYPGMPALSSSERKVLDEYLGRFGGEIHRKLQAVYGPLPPPTV